MTIYNSIRNSIAADPHSVGRLLFAPPTCVQLEQKLRERTSIVASSENGKSTVKKEGIITWSDTTTPSSSPWITAMAI